MILTIINIIIQAPNLSSFCSDIALGFLSPHAETGPLLSLPHV